MIHTKRKRGRGKRKRKGKSDLAACLEEEEMDPRNTEVSANEVKFACRHINLANVLGGNGWERKNCATECSSIFDTGFNGGCLCSFSWLSRYVEYLKIFFPKRNCLKRTNRRWNLFFGNQQARVSAMSTVLPIWVTDSFKPVRARTIEGATELLLGLDIIGKLDITVEFGSDHFMDGQGD